MRCCSTAFTFALLTLAACQNKVQTVTMIPIPQPGENVNVVLAQAPTPCVRDPASIDTTLHGLTAAKIDTLEKNGLCTFDMPEYNDEQSLIHGNGNQYGPVAHAYAYAWGRTYTNAAQFEPSWVLMALVDVDPGPIPSIYGNRLGLVTGRNCLYVVHVISGGGNPLDSWHMAMGTPASDGVCRGGTSKVLATRAEQPSGDANDYPVAARFIEKVPGREPALSIRCGNTLCIAGLEVPADPPAFNGLVGAGSGIRWSIKNWFDDQTLAKGPSGSPLSPFKRLSVVPVDNLGTFDVNTFQSGWTDVATIVVPPGQSFDKYSGTGTGGFALVAGANVISINAQMIAGALKWRARVRNSQYPAGSEHVYAQDVKWSDHRSVGIPIDGTARWAWLATDEAVWIRCDVGCCLVYGD